MHSFNILATAAALSTSATVRIDAGPGLVFRPDSVEAMPGDVLEFHFNPKNHSVAMGDFNNACQMPSMGGFYSGYMPVKEGEAEKVFRVTVNDTNPIWYYCTQSIKPHCKNGMVGVVNPPRMAASNMSSTSNMSLEAYRSAAAATSGKAGERAMPFGGELVTNNVTMGGGSGSGSGSMGGGSKSEAPQGSLKAASAGVVGVLLVVAAGLM